MSNRLMRRIERYLWLSAMLVAVCFALWPWLLTPSPYRDVTLVETYEVDGYRYLHVDWIKNDGCTVQEVVWIGERLGVVYELTEEWFPTNLFEDDPGEHRTAGHQTIQGRLWLNGQVYDAFEIRSRHDCNGKRVDRTFLRLDVGNEITWE